MVTMRLRQPPSMAWMFAALGAVVVAIVAMNVIADRTATEESAPAGPTRLEARTELDAYEKAIYEPVRVAGKAIVAGIRPDISDFRAGRISAAVWQEDMTVRASEFSQAWVALAAVPRPHEVATAEEHFDDSFRTYLLAVQALHEAGDRDGAERDTLIGLGGAIGDAGDQEFDRAAAVIQQARRDAGLSPDPNLPDPEAHR